MNHDPRLIANARRLRRELAPAERVFWTHVRGRRFAGYRFRRQHVIDPYIADFYCAIATLVVELDGETHLGKEAQDRIRQEYLEKQGLKVVRFWNTEIFDELDAVLEAVYRECRQRAEVTPRLPTPRRSVGEKGHRHPSPPPPLPSGERGEGQVRVERLNCPSPPAPLPSGERGARHARGQGEDLPSPPAPLPSERGG